MNDNQRPIVDLKPGPIRVPLTLDVRIEPWFDRTWLRDFITAEVYIGEKGTGAVVRLVVPDDIIGPSYFEHYARMMSSELVQRALAAFLEQPGKLREELAELREEFLNLDHKIGDSEVKIRKESADKTADLEARIALVESRTSPPWWKRLRIGLVHGTAS